LLARDPESAEAILRGRLAEAQVRSVSEFAAHAAASLVPAAALVRR
jgi:hypothetical protein